jgi:hypothetical protein
MYLERSSGMKKLFMLLVLGGLMACASVYAQDEEEDFKIQMDDEESTYPTEEEDNFRIGYVDDWPDEE